MSMQIYFLCVIVDHLSKLKRKMSIFALLSSNFRGRPLPSISRTGGAADFGQKSAGQFISRGL